MKKVITLTLSFIFSLSIYGQNILTATYETWTGSAWANSLKQNNTYDGSGYLTYNLTQIWDSPSSSWKNNGQINYTNNANGTVQQYIAQSWDTPSNSWKNSQRATYTYNNTTGIYEANEFAFHFYPNPSNDMLNLYLDKNSETKIEITDFQGRTLLSKIISGNSTIIDMKDLPSGVYFLRLQQGNKISVAKFIKN
ncbi:MAG: T9SS type A sorting domain-containing protein [Bacteroidia bacterium]|nr:T9SS type A sorting domain-containing protein [Bacteroidia bacterium]